MTGVTSPVSDEFLTSVDKEPFRKRVISVARHMAEQRIKKGTAEYNFITESRNDWKRKDGSVGSYSWCGDFVTCTLMLAKASERGCLNRVATRGSWKVGANIDMLIQCAIDRGAAYGGAKAYPRLMQGNVGDIIVIANDTGGHICFLNRLIAGDSFETADGNTYGGQTGFNTRSISGGTKLAWLLDVDCFYTTLHEQGHTDGPVVPDVLKNPTDETQPSTGPDSVKAVTALERLGVAMGAVVFPTWKSEGQAFTPDDSYFFDIMKKEVV